MRQVIVPLSSARARVAEVVIRGAVLTAGRVHEVQAAAACRLDPVYRQIWLGLTAPQRRALQAIVLEGGDGPCRRHVRTGTTKTRLEDPLFGRWIRESVAPPVTSG